MNPIAAIIAALVRGEGKPDMGPFMPPRRPIAGPELGLIHPVNGRPYPGNDHGPLRPGTKPSRDQGFHRPGPGPKHPNARTFTDGQGNLREVGTGRVLRPAPARTNPHPGRPDRGNEAGGFPKR